MSGPEIITNGHPRGLDAESLADAHETLRDLLYRTESAILEVTEQRMTEIAGEITDHLNKTALRNFEALEDGLTVLGQRVSAMETRLTRIAQAIDESLAEMGDEDA